MHSLRKVFESVNHSGLRYKALLTEFQDHDQALVMKWKTALRLKLIYKFSLFGTSNAIQGFLSSTVFIS